jgi:hypothetical protein
LCGLEEFTRDERFMRALMQLSIPAERAVIQRVLEGSRRCKVLSSMRHATCAS